MMAILIKCISLALYRMSKQKIPPKTITKALATDSNSVLHLIVTSFLLLSSHLRFVLMTIFIFFFNGKELNHNIVCNPIAGSLIFITNIYVCIVYIHIRHLITWSHTAAAIVAVIAALKAIHNAYINTTEPNTAAAAVNYNLKKIIE